ncbi:MAG: iron transporter [Bacillota bacterium]
MKLRKSYLLALLLILVAMSIVATGCGSKTTGAPEGEAPKPGKAAGFEEFPIGDQQEMEGMSIAAVYFQPVVMEPGDKAGLKPDQADIHLEADIKAIEGNQTGFGIGEFVPYLTVNYEIKNLDTSEKQTGSMMPMNASDGPHYGVNVKMMGAGKYQLAYSIESPEKQDYLLHTDQETGVEGIFWTKPLEVSWEFNWLPRKW